MVKANCYGSIRIMPKLTPEASRAARALLNLTTHELGARIGVSPTTINALETGRGVRPSTEAKILDGFASLGVEILNGDAPGARLVRSASK